LPVVLSVDEIRRVIDAVEEPSQLIVKLYLTARCGSAPSHEITAAMGESGDW
jgi:hypothetical protein